MSRQNSSLRDLLRQAERWLRTVDPNTVFTRFNDATAFADYLSVCADVSECGNLKDSQRNELIEIFAPTCDWDDVLGDTALGQAIFDALQLETRSGDLARNGHT